MPDDRDQIFEKALARQLRAEAAAAESSCPDPETLAAYHERNLSLEELSAAKSHIVSCARCQEILARLQTTEALAEAVGDLRAEPETVPALATKIPASVGTRKETLAAAASARSAAPRKITSIATTRWLPLRWAVPAGAVAAGVLLLIGLRESRLAAPKQQAPSQVAENRAPAPAPQESSDALRAVQQDKRVPQLQDKEPSQQFQKSAPSAAPMSSPMSRGENAVRDEKKDFPAGSSLGEAPQLSAKVLRSPAPIPRQRAAGPNVAAGQAQAADAIQQSAPINGRANQQVENAPKAKETAPQPPALDDNAARTTASAGIGGGQGAGKGPVPAPAPPPAPATTEKSLAPTGATQVITGQPASEVADYRRAAKKAGLEIRIPAPGGKKIWSVGPDGQILFSNDSGQSWLPQSSAVSADLVAGSAPSEKVCWIAGAAGTLLRTTDGGNHWQRITTPLTGDLGGVHAADAQHASIWDAPNHLSYETTDGGATWKPSANE